MPISPEEFVERHPRLFHMAARKSWPAIQRHGLLSTSALLDLFEVEGEERLALEERHRPKSVGIDHPMHGTAVIRDQKPMRDADLERALEDGITPTEWYRLLNSRVFFWPNEQRLARMLGAKAYRNDEHIVLTVNTRTLLTAHLDRTVLSRMNSGATRPMPHPRGRDCFLPLGEFPYFDRLSRRLDPVAEVAVQHCVPDIVQHVERVEIARGTTGRVILWSNRFSR